MILCSVPFAWETERRDNRRAARPGKALYGPQVVAATAVAELPHTSDVERLTAAEPVGNERSPFRKHASARSPPRVTTPSRSSRPEAAGHVGCNFDRTTESLRATVFTQTDPMPMGAGTAFESPYAYGMNNPVMYTDPSGMRSRPTYQRALDLIGSEMPANSAWTQKYGIDSCHWPAGYFCYKEQLAAKGKTFAGKVADGMVWDYKGHASRRPSTTKSSRRSTRISTRSQKHRSR